MSMGIKSKTLLIQLKMTQVLLMIPMIHVESVAFLLMAMLQP